MRFKHADVNRYTQNTQKEITHQYTIHRIHTNLNNQYHLTPYSNHTSNIYPSISKVMHQPSFSIDDDNVSLHTKDKIINYVKQIPSKV